MLRYYKQSVVILNLAYKILLSPFPYCLRFVLQRLQGMSFVNACARASYECGKVCLLSARKYRSSFLQLKRNRCWDHLRCALITNMCHYSIMYKLADAVT